MRRIVILVTLICIVVSSGCGRLRRTGSLHEAAYRGSVSEAQRHLDAGADVNAKDRGWTALALAADRGDADVVALLIEAGADIDSTDCTPNGWTALAVASGRGHDGAARVLLDAGADPEALGPGDASATALGAAVEGRHLSTVRLLLEHGARPNGDGSQQWPPLVRAACNNDAAIVRELLDHGAREDAEVLQRAAAYAAANGHAEAYEALVAAGAEATLTEAAGAGSVTLVAGLLEDGANPDGPADAETTPLYAAALEGHARVAEVLIAAGADAAKEAHDWSPLAAAVRYAHDDVVRALLDAGVDIDSREGHPHRKRPLEIAVECEGLSTVELLLDRGAAVGPPQLSYWPIIVEAANRGDAAIVSLLLDHGAGESPGFVHEAAQHAAINRHEGAFRVLVEHGARPTLASAAALGNTAQVREFLEAGNDPNEMVVGRFLPLHAAARGGHVKIMKILLDAGADPEEGMGVTVLGTAAAWGQPEVVNVLVENGADVNGLGEYGFGQSPLECAIEVENEELVGLLLELGADPCLKGEHAQIPLTVAARSGNVEILKLLVETGDCSDADLRLAAGAALERDNTAAYDLLASSGIELTLPMAARQGDLEAVKRLLAEGADVNSPSEDGSPPLPLAAGGGHADTVKVLLDAGADVNASDRWDKTALHHAAGEGYLAIARTLIRAGADVSATPGFHGAPLHEAARGGHLEMIRLLVESGADPNARSDYEKKRPLHAARWADNPAPVIKLLVELGADPDAVTEQKVTPLNEAVKAGNIEATRALLEVGADPDLPNSGGNSARDLAEMCEFEELIELIESYD